MGTSSVERGAAGRVAAALATVDQLRETVGQVLLWEGEVFPAFYHAESGGYTEDPRAVFAASNMPALNAVRCAIDVQRDIAAADTSASILAPTKLRVGVHFCGEVSATHAIEDGLRTALRMTEMAEPGEIAKAPPAGAAPWKCKPGGRRITSARPIIISFRPWNSHSPTPVKPASN